MQRHPSPIPRFPSPASESLRDGQLTRRRFLKLAAAAGTLAVPGGGALRAAQSEVARLRHLPQPQRSGIEHVVLVMMENRSFDHVLGWLRGADGRQAGLTYLDRAGAAHNTFALAPEYQGCAFSDPDHSYDGGRIEYNHGACDGWLRAGDNDLFSIGYYTPADLPFLASAAASWTVCDRYFAPIMAETFPNRIYQHAAQTDRLDNPIDLSSLPTIWDRLDDAGLGGRYYYSDLAFTALWGLKYQPISRPVTEFFDACASGNLPEFSMVDPKFVGEAAGTTNDDHPHADIRHGEVFLNSIYEAVVSSPKWANTILVINFDEWGGFFEHVPPPSRPVPPADAALGNDGLLGFRVPCLIVSPWSRRGYVDHGIFDHTSVLRLVEWRWDLEPLTIRDATANNLAEALDFHHRHLKVSQFEVPSGPFGAACQNTSLSDQWMLLAEWAQTIGFGLL